MYSVVKPQITLIINGWRAEVTVSYDLEKQKINAEDIECRIVSVSTKKEFFRISLYLMLYKRIAFTCCRCCVLDYFFLNL